MPEPAGRPSQRAAAGQAGRRQEHAPERAVRRVLHARGLRFGLRPRDLPGRPDIVLPGRRAVVFVHGCFWHGHGCALDRSAARFKAGTWADEIAANQANDARDQEALRAAGWQVETVWECEVDRPQVVDALAARLLRR